MLRLAIILGRLRRNETVPPDTGSFPVARVTLVILLIAMVIIVGALSCAAALAVPHLMMPGSSVGPHPRP